MCRVTHYGKCFAISTIILIISVSSSANSNVSPGVAQPQRCHRRGTSCNLGGGGGRGASGKDNQRRGPAPGT
jgi:hypothetical protein